jgi:NitT/TauT family transport system permease protein
VSVLRTTPAVAAAPDGGRRDGPTGLPSGELTRMGRWTRSLVGVAVLGAVFEVLGRIGLVERAYLPPTSTVVARAAELVGSGEFRADVAATLTAAALGLTMAIALGVALGVLLGSVRGVNTAARVVIEFLRPIPSVALVPFATLLLGVGTQMKVSLIVYAATWPVLFNTLYGLTTVDPVAKDTLRSFGFGRLDVLRRVSLPSTAPFIATGVRVAAAISLVVSIAVEVLSGYGAGIGIFIAQASNIPDSTSDVLAAMVWSGLIGLVVNVLLVRGERRLFRWHRARADSFG